MNAKEKAKRILEEDKEVGRRIRARRLALGMSQTELADSVGVTFQQVQKYEKGINRVSAGRLHRVADVLQVPITALLTENTHPNDDPCLQLSQSRIGMRIIRGVLLIGKTETEMVLRLVEHFVQRGAAR